MDKIYIDTVRLLLQAIPHVFVSPDFALKGGTALNLFVQDMPRLSVDLDVAFVDRSVNRDTALARISAALSETQARFKAMNLKAQMGRSTKGDEVKLLVSNNRSQMKVEVNYVFRGTVMPPERRSLAPAARELFTADLDVPILPLPELYGSKLVAALDRQHPRDLFDVMAMYQRFGLTQDIVECFVCYLAGHNRPLHEVLFPDDRDLTMAYSSDFLGLTTASVPLNALIEIRQRLKHELPCALTTAHRRFLLSLANGEPEWTNMTCGHLAELPAIRWKLENLAKLKRTNPEKFERQVEKLEALLA